MSKKKVKMSKEQKLELSRNVRHLEVMIKYSKQAVTKQGNSIDEFFKRQAKRLEKELKELKK